MAKRFLYWTVGISLLPVLWAASREFVLMVPSVMAEGVRTWWLYALGAVTYLMLERLFSRPMTIYVFGHELTHVLSGLLSGARVHSFKATSRGGEVRMSKSNLFVTLSPYIIPIYSLVIIALFAVIRVWWNKPPLSVLFQFMLGVTLAFHVSMTIAAIHKKQPDLKLMGIFLSGVLIGIGNTIILGLFCVSLFKKTPTFKNYSLHLTQETVRVWKWGVQVAGERVQEAMASPNPAKPKVKYT